MARLGFLQRPILTDVSPLAFILLERMLDSHDFGRGSAFFYKATLMKFMGCTERHLVRLVNELEAKGYLWVYQRHNHHNLYVVPPLPGEVFEDGQVIPERDIIIDPASKLTWTRRKPSTKAAETEPEPPTAPHTKVAPVAPDPDDPPDIPSARIAASPVEDDPLHDDPEIAAHNDDKLTRRAWWDTLRQQQPTGPTTPQETANWELVIDGLIVGGYDHVDFVDAWNATATAWKNGRPSVTAVWRNFGALMIEVRKQRAAAVASADAKARREAQAVALAAVSKPKAITDEDRKRAEEIEAQIRARRQKRNE